MTQLENINSKLDSTEHSHIGDAVFWTVRENRIDPSELRNAFQETDLPKNVIPKDPTPEIAFRRAIDKAKLKHAQRGFNRSQDRSEDYLLRKISETHEAIVWAVVKESCVLDDTATERRNSKTLEYETLDKITLDRVTGRVTCINEHAMSEVVAGNYEDELFSFNSSDLRTILLKLMDTFSGIAIRPTGGIYFVPSTNAEKLKALQGVLENLSPGSSLGIINLYGTEDSEAALRQAAMEDLETSVNRLSEELEGFDDSTRDSTIEKRLKKAGELRKRVDMYVTLLDISRENLECGLGEVEKSLSELLGLN